MSSPYDVVKQLESELCSYSGAKYAVTTNSCTMALLLACKYHIETTGTYTFEIPSKTYVGVPMSIINAGGIVDFRDQEWSGAYQVYSEHAENYIWDYARMFTSNMFKPNSFQCVSFHASKILSDTQGGAILHDSDEADTWLRKARFDGRTEGVAPKDDGFDMLGYHCYLSPDVAARLLLKLSVLPKNNPPLPNDDYPDLSTFEVFK